MNQLRQRQRRVPPIPPWDTQKDAMHKNALGAGATNDGASTGPTARNTAPAAHQPAVKRPSPHPPARRPPPSPWHTQKDANQQSGQQSNRSAMSTAPSPNHEICDGMRARAGDESAAVPRRDACEACGGRRGCRIWCPHADQPHPTLSKRVARATPRDQQRWVDARGTRGRSGSERRG